MNTGGSGQESSEAATPTAAGIGASSGPATTRGSLGEPQGIAPQRGLATKGIRNLPRDTSLHNCNLSFAGFMN